MPSWKVKNLDVQMELKNHDDTADAGTKKSTRCRFCGLAGFDAARLRCAQSDGGRETASGVFAAGTGAADGNLSDGNWETGTG